MVAIRDRLLFFGDLANFTGVVLGHQTFLATDADALATSTLRYDVTAKTIAAARAMTCSIFGGGIPATSTQTEFLFIHPYIHSFIHSIHFINSAHKDNNEKQPS